MSFHPPQIPRRLAWAGVRNSEAKAGRLTAWTVAWPPCFIYAFFLVFRSQFQTKIMYTDFMYFDPFLKAQFCSILWDEVRLKISPKIWKGQISYFEIVSVFRWQNISWYSLKPFLLILSSHLVASLLTSSFPSDPNQNLVWILETSKSTNVTNNRTQNTNSVYHFQRCVSTEWQ